MTDPRKNSGNPRFGERSIVRRLMMLGGVFALGLGLALAVPVWARHGHGPGHGWLEDGEFIEFMAERKLRHIDASEEQRGQILALVSETRERLLALRGEGSPREAFVEQLVSDPGDTEELEMLRSTQIARFDQGSRILVDAATQIAEVLTPAQREQLAEMHRARHTRWHR